MEEERPSSPSILFAFSSRKRKYRETENSNNKQTQTEYTITDTMVYRKTSKKGNISYSTRHLPNVNFDDRRPSDKRNEDFARLVAFELERLPENKRSNAYPQILNLIRLLRGDPDLDRVIEFVPIRSESEGEETEEQSIPLNVAL
jgi:hypothetical protein